MLLDFDKMTNLRPFASTIMSSIDEWAFAFGVTREAIIKQFPIMDTWMNANPKKAPKKNIRRFCVNWFTKAKTYGNLTTVPRPTFKEERPAEDMSFEEMVAIRRQNMGGR